MRSSFWRNDYLCPMISKSKATSQVLLQCQPNFRDLGGIIAKNGHKIKPGLLFRSGDLHSISDEDVAKLEEIGLATIVDFRSEREREWRPDKKIRTVRNIYHMTIPLFLLTEEARFNALKPGYMRRTRML